NKGICARTRVRAHKGKAVAGGAAPIHGRSRAARAGALSILRAPAPDGCPSPAPSSCRCSAEFAQLFQKAVQCPCPMADTIFLGGIKFCHGATLLRQPEV